MIEFVEKKITNKPQFDNITTLDIINDILFNKNPSDNIITSEDVDVVLNRRLFNSIGALDSGIAEQPNVYANDYFAQTYSEGLVETGVDIDFFKVLNDTTTTSEVLVRAFAGGEIISELTSVSEISAVDSRKYLENSTSLTDNSERLVNKSIENSINITDGGTIEFNAYSIGYFASNYVEGITPF